VTTDTKALHILQHALGLDEHGRDSRGALCPAETYRQHFVTDDDSDDGTACNALVAAGMMTRHAPRVVSGDMPIFAVTEAGRAFVREHSPRPPKVSRAGARYMEWLRACDVAPDVSFGAFLRRGGSWRKVMGSWFVSPAALASWRRLAGDGRDANAVRADICAVLDGRVAAYAADGRQPEQTRGGMVVYRLARSTLPSRARLRIVVSYATGPGREAPQIVDVLPETGAR